MVAPRTKRKRASKARAPVETPAPARLPNGQFPPGTSGNPNGRPPGRVGLAAYLREQTENGQELGDRALAIVRNPKHHDHMRAIDWVEERMHGKLPQALSIGSPEEVEKWRAAAESQAAFENLSEPELEQALADKLRARGFTVARPTAPEPPKE